MSFVHKIAQICVLGGIGATSRLMPLLTAHPQPHSHTAPNSAASTNPSYSANSCTPKHRQLFASSSGSGLGRRVGCNSVIGQASRSNSAASPGPVSRESTVPLGGRARPPARRRRTRGSAMSRVFTRHVDPGVLVVVAVVQCGAGQQLLDPGRACAAVPGGRLLRAGRSYAGRSICIRWRPSPSVGAQRRRGRSAGLRIPREPPRLPAADEARASAEAATSARGPPTRPRDRH